MTTPKPVPQVKLGIPYRWIRRDGNKDTRFSLGVFNGENDALSMSPLVVDSIVVQRDLFMFLTHPISKKISRESRQNSLGVARVIGVQRPFLGWIGFSLTLVDFEEEEEEVTEQTCQ